MDWADIDTDTDMDIGADEGAATTKAPPDPSSGALSLAAVADTADSSGADLEDDTVDTAADGADADVA